MKVYWLEQSEADVPLGDDWLSATERVFVSAMSIAKRRVDWRLGRWTAKQAVASFLSLPVDVASLSRMEIGVADSGAPLVALGNEAAQVSISLSHSNGRAACALAPAGVSLGCDLESVEPRSDAFIADYFTDDERDTVARAPAQERTLTINLIWSAKESALKAMQVGLRNDTRSVSVNLDGGRPDLQIAVHALGHEHKWRELQVRCENGRVFDGLWHGSDGLVRTLVAGWGVIRADCLKDSR